MTLGTAVLVTAVENEYVDKIMKTYFQYSVINVVLYNVVCIKRFQTVLLSVVLLCSVLLPQLAFAEFDKISVKEAHQLSSQGDVILIDIRSEQEWRKTGVAPQAKTISMHQKGGIPAFESELTALLQGNKDTPIALICAGGVRSARLQDYLQKKGFGHVADVKEGMLGGFISKGWIDYGLPTTDYSIDSK